MKEKDAPDPLALAPWHQIRSEADEFCTQESALNVAGCILVWPFQKAWIVDETIQCRCCTKKINKLNVFNIIIISAWWLSIKQYMISTTKASNGKSRAGRRWPNIRPRYKPGSLFIPHQVSRQNVPVKIKKREKKGKRNNWETFTTNWKKKCSQPHHYSYISQHIKTDPFQKEKTEIERKLQSSLLAKGTFTGTAKIGTGYQSTNEWCTLVQSESTVTQNHYRVHWNIANNLFCYCN